jgi:hypothetical protein
MYFGRRLTIDDMGAPSMSRVDEATRRRVDARASSHPRILASRIERALACIK